ncbi:MAG: lysozyme inhibitor LprI family protein [Pseudomonadota bacterium]
MRYLCILALFMFASASASAKCERDKYGAFADVQCASEAAKLADLELNAVYKRMLDSVDAHSRQRLVDAQRKWLAFFLAHIQFIEKLDGRGADGQLTALNANEKYKRARADDLRQWIRQN